MVMAKSKSKDRESPGERQTRKAHKEMIHRRNTLHNSLQPEFGLGAGDTDPENFVTEPGIWQYVGGKPVTLIPDSHSLVRSFAAEQSMTADRVREECVRILSETPAKIDLLAKVQGAGARVQAAYEIYEESRQAYYHDGWYLARRIGELRDAEANYRGRPQSHVEIAKLLLVDFKINLSQQRVGQCLNTPDYFPAEAVDQTISLRTYDDARRINESSSQKLTPVELAEIVKSHRQREGLGSKIKAAIVVKYPAPVVPAAQPATPAVAPEVTQKSEPNESSFHSAPEPNAPPSQSDAPQTPAVPSHEISIIAKIVGAGPVTLQVMYDGSIAIPDADWVDVLISHTVDQLRFIQGKRFKEPEAADTFHGASVEHAQTHYQ
jgi:hypothetical protein